MFFNNCNNIYIFIFDSFNRSNSYNIMGIKQKYNFFKKKGGWWTSREIVDNSSMSDHSVSRALKNLRENYPNCIKTKFKDKLKKRIYMYKAR